MSPTNMPSISITKENHLNYHKSAWDEFFLGTHTVKTQIFCFSLADL